MLLNITIVNEKFKYSEITPENIYNKRRSFIKSIGYGLQAHLAIQLPFVNANL